MQPVKLDLMLEYRYLSNLNTYNNELLFIDTLADSNNNDYTQRLHSLNPENGEDKIILEDKRIRYSVVDNKLIIIKRGSGEFNETLIEDINGNKLMTLPLNLGLIESLNDDYYYVEASIDLKASEYHTYSDEEKKAYHESLKKESDYLVLDEYPFFFNGAGFINGMRNRAFIVNKHDLSIKAITPKTMDVEGHVIIDGKLYLMANGYESMKEMWSSVYEYHVENDTLVCLYHNDHVFVRRLVRVNDKLCVLASEKTCIYGQSFYEIENHELKKIYETEYMFWNSVGSDCRYGKFRNSMTKDGVLYILNTVNERSLLESFDGHELKELTDFEGSVDDFTFIGDELYIIAMKDMKLEEIYHVGDTVERITSLNEDVLKDKYVAKPERLSFENIDEIRGFVLKPINYDENKKYPMILDIHGGPKTAYGEVFYHEMQLWASMGYFVAFSNPHCSDGRGDDFTDYLKHYGATDYDDIMMFVDEVLKKYPAIDEDRLCVTGGSYGGYMTNWIITHTDRFKAAASQRSISNRVADFYYSDYSYDVTYENGIPNDAEAIKLFWDRSPIKYVDNAVTPTLFIQSTEDYRCPFPEALQLFSALKWKGVETRICGFKGENHELSRSGKPSHRLRRLEEITNWMEKHVR